MKVKVLVLLTVVFLCKNLSAQNVADIINYISTYKEIAIDEMQRSGVPASIILAQGIHETEAGTSELVKKSNNHFGIKCKDTWTGSVVYHDDDERGECFRSYNKPEDSYKDHSDFLKSSSRYSFLFKLDPTDYQSWAYGLKKAGYATNIHYPQILVKLIEDYNLEQYTLIALGKINRGEERFVSNETGKSLSSTPVSNTVATINTKKITVSLPPAPQYPSGEFTLNKTRVFFAKSGSSLLSIANQYNMPLSRLLDFNDLKEEDVLPKDQLLFLQRKRKVGNNEFHIVQEGESLYDICQSEGIRFESLLELNQLRDGEQPAIEEKLYLQNAAQSKPVLATEKNKQQSIAYEKTIEGTNNISVLPVTHIVQTKETLYSISRKYNVDTEKIKEWNKLGSQDLKTGQELIIYKN
jgi:LysM repeat protein